MVLGYTNYVDRNGENKYSIKKEFAVIFNDILKVLMVYLAICFIEKKKEKKEIIDTCYGLVLATLIWHILKSVVFLKETP